MSCLQWEHNPHIFFLQGSKKRKKSQLKARSLRHFFAKLAVEGFMVLFFVNEFY
jgi:hypothetical protein